jgi:hypothetical protein
VARVLASEDRLRHSNKPTNKRSRIHVRQQQTRFCNGFFYSLNAALSGRGANAFQETPSHLSAVRLNA